MLKTANEAFSKILDSLYQNDIINIDADFEVIIFFWDDIQTEICRKTELLKKYYPHFGVDFRVPLECKNELISKK